MPVIDWQPGLTGTVTGRGWTASGMVNAVSEYSVFVQYIWPGTDRDRYDAFRKSDGPTLKRHGCTDVRFTVDQA